MSQTAKIAVVTGANKGLGFEIGKQLVAKGLHVVVTARDADKGEQALQRLNTANAEFFQLDVTSSANINALAEHLKTQHGRCDVLVNNAGIFPDPRDDLENNWPSILHADLADIQRGLETNSFAPLRLCQQLIPIMQQNGYGRVVNMSSGMGQLSIMHGCCPVYRISKPSLNVITRILADELQGQNLLINSLCPGWVKTDMGGPGATREIPEGADTAVWLATLPDGGPSGGFFRDRKPIPW